MLLHNSAGDGKMTKDVGDAVELLDTLANNSSLSPALEVLIKLFPAHAIDIGNRFWNIKRTLEVDFDIIDSYIAYGGDINKPNCRGISCLRALLNCYLESQAECKWPMKLFTFLVVRGADVNVRNQYGQTVLHAVFGNSFMTVFNNVKFAIEGSGASVSREDHSSLIPNVLPSEHLERQIESLQLFGAQKVPHYGGYRWMLSDDHRMFACYTAWSLAIELKQLIKKDAANDLATTEPHPIYGYVREANSVKELQALITDLSFARVQALIFLDKILGPEHEETFLRRLQNSGHFWYLGDINKWLWNLKECFVQIFSFKLSSSTRNKRLNELQLKFKEVATPRSHNKIQLANIHNAMIEYLQVVVDTVITVRQNLNSEHEPLSGKEIEKLLRLILNLITLFCFASCSKPENGHFRKLLKKVLSLGLATDKRKTLLLEAVALFKYSTEKNKGYISPVIHLLLESGADVNEIDFFGNTVLNCIVQDFESRSNYRGRPTHDETKLVQAFVDYGLHYDIEKYTGVKVSDLLQRYFGIEVPAVKDLQCLAARVIRSHNIPCEGILSKTLYRFVEMH